MGRKSWVRTGPVEGGAILYVHTMLGVVEEARAENEVTGIERKSA